MSATRAVVVVPARDEEARIGACLDALAAQEPAPDGIVVVAHRCTDRTVAAVDRWRAHRAHPPVTVLECDHGGVGTARRAGFEHAAAALAPTALLATTDADTEVAPGWLAEQLRLVALGAQAIGGLVELAADEAAALPPAVRADRARRLAARLATARAEAAPGVPTEHPFFSGASIGVTVEAYRRAGGLRADGSLEDEALAAGLRRAGIPIWRPAGVRVTTSARTDGRADRGLAVDLAVADWRARRRYRADDFADVAALAATRRDSVSIVFPAREEAATIGDVVAVACRLREAGLVDEVVVVDAASADGTAEAARAAGATVHQQDDLLAGWGPCRGKGDAMWRALSVVTGDVVCFLDADTANFTPAFVTGTLGPLLSDPAVAVAKGSFARPLRVGEVQLPGEGGRVTELAARPLLNLWFPVLAGFDQPLSGELAIRSDLARQLPFPVGYGVEIANLIDAERRCGLDAMAQVDLGTRLNRHQPLRDLSAMAYAVLAAAARRLPGGEPGPAPGPLLLPGVDGLAEVRQVAVEERPPIASL